FPSPNGAFVSLQGQVDAFVAKLDPTLTGTASLLYSTYLGGSGVDRGHGIAVDGIGKVYVTGETYSTNFPSPNGAFVSLQGQVDAFVAKLDPTLTGTASLRYSTYLGGGCIDKGYAIAVDASRLVYATGETNSSSGSCAPPFSGALSSQLNG